jgi:hypothetical protein
MHTRGVVKGKSIELAEILPYAEGCIVNVIIEPEDASLQRGSPTAIRQAMRAQPCPSEEDVSEMEQAINAGQLPVQESSVFDGRR